MANPCCKLETMSQMLACLLLLNCASSAMSQMRSFSWDTLPVAFHGANMSGDYSNESIEQLAKYNMVTIEKWMGPCGAQHAPHNMSSSCQQEEVIAKTLNTIRAANKRMGSSAKNQSLMMYLNSNFAFPFYQLAEKVKAIDGLLRDINGDVCMLNNDGNMYLNVPFYDWSQRKVQELYQETATKYVNSGVADGFFADHASQAISFNASAGQWQICNGGFGKSNNTGRRCCVFDKSKAAAVNEGHQAALRATQQALGWRGLLINHAPQVPRESVNSTIWGDLVNLQVGRPGTAPTNSYLSRDHGLGYAVEVRVASPGYGPRLDRGLCNQGGVMDENLLAAFLLSVQENQYWACFASQGGSSYVPPRPFETALPPWFKEYDLPLGRPLGQASVHDGIISRKFAAGVEALWDVKKGEGTVTWANQAAA